MFLNKRSILVCILHTKLNQFPGGQVVKGVKIPNQSRPMQAWKNHSISVKLEIRPWPFIQLSSQDALLDQYRNPRQIVEMADFTLINYSTRVQIAH